MTSSAVTTIPKVDYTTTPHPSGVKALSLKDAPALIESLLPVQKISVDSYKEQMAVQGKILTDTRTFAPNTKKVDFIDWVFANYAPGTDESLLYDKTFVKLREATLSYSFASNLLEKTPFKSASVSLVGRNLLMWTNVPFMDPDGYSGLNLAEPSYRNIGFNLDIKF
mgnify:CR=1 FL=1